MIEYWEPLVTVILLQAAMIIDPGPDYALILRLSTNKQSARLAASGLGLGALLLLLLSILGLNSLFLSVPSVATTIRYLGALWLLWQAVITFFPHKRKKSRGQKDGPFVSGVLNHALNIEMILFYIAVISQLETRNVPINLQVFASIEMALFTTVWFLILTKIVTAVPNSKQLLTHPVVRIGGGILFLVSALNLIR